jgi:hypothetical protein
LRASELAIRAITNADREVLAEFTCSSGEPWEEQVQDQIRGPLPSRYLTAPPYFDGRMLLGFSPFGELLVLGAHHIEPSFAEDVGYTEVIAVALAARGTLVELPRDDPVSLGQFMLLTIFRQMLRLGRHPRTFVRIERHNIRSLRLATRAGLCEERDDPEDPDLVQRWGRLPAK